jgi:hypothetical protein
MLLETSVGDIPVYPSAFPSHRIDQVYMMRLTETVQ